MLGLETQLSSITIAIGLLYVEPVPTTHLICILSTFLYTKFILWLYHIICKKVLYFEGVQV